MENLKDIKYFQELTFKRLNELMEEESKRGNSVLYMSEYTIGDEMAKYLSKRGFLVYRCNKSHKTSSNYISW